VHHFFGVESQTEDIQIKCCSPGMGIDVVTVAVLLLSAVKSCEFELQRGNIDGDFSPGPG